MKWARERAARCSRIASAPDCSARTSACATLSNGATGSFLFKRFETHRHDVRQVNGGLRRQRDFDMLIRLDAVDHLDARRNAVAIDGRTELAQVLDEKLSGGRIPANLEMLA